MALRRLVRSFILFAALPQAQAAAEEIRLAQLAPAWARKAAQSQQANGSYLSSVRNRSSQTSGGELMDSKKALELRQQYDDMVRNYEQRKVYRQNSAQEDQQHTQKVRGFSRTVVREVEKQQITQQTAQAKKAAENDPVLSKAAKPLGIVAAGVAIYYGAPVNFDMGSETQLTARTVVPRSEGSLSLNSPLIRTSADFLYAAPRAGQDQVRLGVSRELGWDMSSGLSYGNTTQSTTASVSKKLNENLTWVVDSSNRTAASASGEQTTRILYGISF